MQIFLSVYPWPNPCLALTSLLTGIMARIAHTDYGTDIRIKSQRIKGKNPRNERQKLQIKALLNKKSCAGTSKPH